LGLQGDKAAIALKSGDLVSPVIAWDMINCSFSGDELASPGEYYPPTLPINDQSRAGSLHLSSGDEAAKTFKSAVAILQTLGIQDAKLTTWFENEIWKNSPNFQGKYAGANGVEISLHVGVNDDQKYGRLSVSLSQSKSPKPPGTELQTIPKRQVRPIQAR
jgi:hypothetical protein